MWAKLHVCYHAATSILFLLFMWTPLAEHQCMIGEDKLCTTNTLMAMMYRSLHVYVNWTQGCRTCNSADNHWVCFRALWAQPGSDPTPLCCHIIQTVKCMNSSLSADQNPTYSSEVNFLSTSSNFSNSRSHCHFDCTLLLLLLSAELFWTPLLRSCFTTVKTLL